MTTVSAGPTARFHPVSAPARGIGSQYRAMLIGALLVLIAVLIVDNHVMALSGGSIADIGVARTVLRDAAGGAAAHHRAANHEGALRSSSTARSAHELRHCFVQARRSGLNPASCRTAP